MAEIRKRVCDLCHAETKGKLAKLSAPKKWAKGQYEEDPAPTQQADPNTFFYAITFLGGPREAADSIDLDICRHCFKALFGAAAWLRDLLRQQEAKG